SAPARGRRRSQVPPAAFARETLAPASPHWPLPLRTHLYPALRRFPSEDRSRPVRKRRREQRKASETPRKRRKLRQHPRGILRLIHRSQRGAALWRRERPGSCARAGASEFPCKMLCKSYISPRRCSRSTTEVSYAALSTQLPPHEPVRPLSPRRLFGRP